MDSACNVKTASVELITPGDLITWNDTVIQEMRYDSCEGRYAAIIINDKTTHLSVDSFDGIVNISIMKFV